MRPKSIGIVGGAGPMAGVLLLKQIFQLAQELHGCWKDADFPKVILISFPFSDMLSKDTHDLSIRKELTACLDTLRKNGAEILGIACNTLHAFLDPQENDLFQLPKLLAQTNESPLILGTSISAHLRLYGNKAIYPDPKVQKLLDEIIVKTLKGESTLDQLQTLILDSSSKTVVLACTELSLYTKDLRVIGKTIVDPLQLLAKRLIQESFGI